MCNFHGNTSSKMWSFENQLMAPRVSYDDVTLPGVDVLKTAILGVAPGGVSSSGGRGSVGCVPGLLPGRIGGGGGRGNC